MCNQNLAKKCDCALCATKIKKNKCTCNITSWNIWEMFHNISCKKATIYIIMYLIKLSSLIHLHPVGSSVFVF